MAFTYVCSLAMVLSLCAMSMSQSEAQPPSGPPDMLALSLTRLDAKSMSLLYAEHKKTYTLRLTPQTVFCNYGKREKSWEYLQQHIGKEKNVITVKTTPDQTVALVVWNTGPSMLLPVSGPVSGAIRLDFPASCVEE